MNSDLPRLKDLKTRKRYPQISRYVEKCLTRVSNRGIFWLLDLIWLIDETDFHGIYVHISCHQNPLDMPSRSWMQPPSSRSMLPSLLRRNTVGLLDFFGHWILSDSTISKYLWIQGSPHISKDLNIYGFGRFVFPMLLQLLVRDPSWKRSWTWWYQLSFHLELFPTGNKHHWVIEHQYVAFSHFGDLRSPMESTQRLRWIDHPTQQGPGGPPNDLPWWRSGSNKKWPTLKLGHFSWDGKTIQNKHKQT